MTVTSSHLNIGHVNYASPLGSLHSQGEKGKDETVIVTAERDGSSHGGEDPIDVV